MPTPNLMYRTGEYAIISHFRPAIRYSVMVNTVFSLRLSLITKSIHEISRKSENKNYNVLNTLKQKQLSQESKKDTCTKSYSNDEL